MRILVLAYKDLSQIVRDWKSGLFLLVMPLLFTLFFGFVFGGSNTKPEAFAAAGGCNQSGSGHIGCKPAKTVGRF